MSFVLEIDAGRVVEELRELADLTGDENGAQRLAWTPGWMHAREWLSGKLDEIGLPVGVDPAGNLWATLEGRSSRSLIVGSHLDSVKNGGWLDGALGVVAGLAIIRALAAAGEPPSLTVLLVDWADEEGSRFGRSLVGSSAAAKNLGVADFGELRDADGISARDALAECGIEIDRMGDAGTELKGAVAYLELHIEQGPELDAEGLAVGVVGGINGVVRHAVRFTGRTAHAGAQPMPGRRDPLLSAARLALEIRRIANDLGGKGTVGRIDASPGAATAVAGSAAMLIDQRHSTDAELELALGHAQQASKAIAAEEGTSVEWERLLLIEPVEFDRGLTEIATRVVEDAVGNALRLESGALHDAAEVARSGVPTSMLFAQSIGGLSHERGEDTRPEDIEVAAQALAEIAGHVLEANE